MWNRAFENLRRKMTFHYALIFGVLILAVVCIVYFLVWYEIMQHEKEGLLAQIYHEGEEYVDSREEPVSSLDYESGNMLAYFVSADGKTVLIDQLTEHPAGKVLFKNRDNWPVIDLDKDVKMLRLIGPDGERYRYLAATAYVWDEHQIVGRLYLFKNMYFYYQAACKTLFVLFCVALVLFMLACVLGYWMAGKNIAPINIMYEKQKQFTADASHEMRTPLAVMSLAVQGLEHDEDSKYSQFAGETIAMMKDEVNRLSHLTETLMELARRESTGAQVRKEPVNLVELTCGVVNKLQVIVAKKHSLIKTSMPQKLAMRGDPDALNMLLVILVDNALKYSPERSLVEVRLAERKGAVMLEVADNGPGIADSDKLKIFDRFYRVDKARSRAAGGLGLGLALALAIVKLHGGTITPLDNMPTGCVMQVILPK